MKKVRDDLAGKKIREELIKQIDRDFPGCIIKNLETRLDHDCGWPFYSARLEVTQTFRVGAEFVKRTYRHDGLRWICNELDS